MASTISAGTTSGTAIAVAGDTTGILQLQTNGTTTAMTIDTSQNVGIGVTSPTGKVAIDATNSNTPRIVFKNPSASGDGAISTFNSSTGTDVIVGSNAYINSAGNFARFDSAQAGSYVYANRTGLLLFGTNDTSGVATERMRITSGGDLLVGTTTSSGKFTVNQTDTGTRTISASSPASYAATVFRSDSAATSGTGWYHLYGSSSSGTVNNIFIYGNGNIQNANNSYGAISDIKLKENIVDATPKLDKLMQVKVRNYNLKGEYEQHKQIGVIAQELEIIFPSLIEETQDRGENDELLGTTTKSVKYSVFVPILIKAIQELKAELDATKAEVQALKGAA